MVKLLCEKQDGKTILLEAGEPILRVSAYGILLSGRLVLLTKTYQPLWEFPGGSVEKSEKLSRTLQREFREETGVDVTVKKFVAERESFYLSPTGKIFHSFQHFFLVTKKRKKFLANLSIKNTLAQWVPLATLSPKNMKKSAWDILSFLENKAKNENFLSACR